jgi:hypothetical protein
MKDPFGNIWGLYEKVKSEIAENKSTANWHSSKPSEIHTTLMTAMKNLK